MSYKQRYYASFCKENKHVTGWYDIKSLSHTNNVPLEKELHALTDKEWENREPTGFGIVNGKLVKMEQVIDRVHRAETLLHEARLYVQNNFILLGEVPTQEWIDYQKSLIAIVNGSDASIPTNPNEK